MLLERLSILCTLKIAKQRDEERNTYVNQNSVKNGNRNHFPS